MSYIHVHHVRVLVLSVVHHVHVHVRVIVLCHICYQYPYEIVFEYGARLQVKIMIDLLSNHHLHQNKLAATATYPPLGLVFDRIDVTPLPPATATVTTSATQMPIPPVTSSVCPVMYVE